MKERDEIRDFFAKHGEYLPTERALSDGLKAQVADLTSQMMEIEELLCISS